MSSKSGKIQSIEFLRFLALLEVFLVHYLNEYSNNNVKLTYQLYPAELV